jgi:hypothetical protein
VPPSLFWSETGKWKIFGTNIFQEDEKQVCTVKSCANHRIRDLSFEVGDFVYLKVSSMRGLRRFKV